MPAGGGVKCVVRVLLVEDDATLAAIVLEALAEDGHSATHVREPFEALRLASIESWDAFVVDGFGPSHRQPDADYRAAVQCLAACGPVVVTTGRAWAAQAQAAELGVHALLTKPYDLGELIGTLSSLPQRDGPPPAA